MSDNKQLSPGFRHPSSSATARLTGLRRCRTTAARALRTGLAVGAGLFAAAASASYSDDPAALALVDSLVEEHGFSREELLAVMDDATYQQSIIDAITRPAEKSKPWYEYRAIFLTEKREREGIAFFRAQNNHLGE